MAFFEFPSLYFFPADCRAGKLHADVFKLGHHGSNSSTMPEFLESVGPEIAIISAGEQNPYGRGSGARILRTDREGAVRVVTDGHRLRVSCLLGCSVDRAVSGSVKAPDHDEGNQ